MVKLVAQIEGVGLLGPGLDSWTSSIAVLEGRSPYISQPTVLPTPDGLPPAERRRLGRVVKLALGAGLQATSKAGVDPATLPAVFASSGGDGNNCHEICQALSLDERLISPTRFHNSVHNAAAGYWSIATGSRAASNAVCAFDASFAAGLLEAVTQVVVDHTRVLLVAYDAQYPAPLFVKRPIPEAFGVAFVLAPVGASASEGAPAARSADAALATSVAGSARRPSETSLGRLMLSFSDSPADRMGDPALESLRASIPAARSLPLLYQLAVRQPAIVHIDYLDGRSVAVEVNPCT
jgi:Beta-ketoacyl synthase, N-terminal domain